MVQLGVIFFSIPADQKQSCLIERSFWLFAIHILDRPSANFCDSPNGPPPAVF